MLERRAAGRELALPVRRGADPIGRVHAIGQLHDHRRRADQRAIDVDHRAQVVAVDHHRARGAPELGDQALDLRAIRGIGGDGQVLAVGLDRLAVLREPPVDVGDVVVGAGVLDLLVGLS